MIFRKSRIIHDERHNETFIPDDIQEEIDAYDRLVEDIRRYVENCVEDGKIPDGFAFATMYKYIYGGAPGNVIDKIITREESRVKKELERYGED
jgi:hypothetical protein